LFDKIFKKMNKPINKIILFHQNYERFIGLLPFIENALWHGLSLKKGHKKLDIVIENDKPSHIKIKIIDNGIGRIKSQKINKQKMLKRKSIGINLTKERLKSFFKNYQNSYSLNFTDLYDENNNPKGTKVVILLPLI